MSGSSQITVGGLRRVQTTAKAIRYHTTETRRLLAVTIDGLSHNCIELFGMGDAEDGVFILSGGLKLTPHAAAQLLLFAGGTGPGGVAYMDRRTVSFLDAVNISSPAGYKGAPVDYGAQCMRDVAGRKQNGKQPLLAPCWRLKLPCSTSWTSFAPSYAGSRRE